MSARNFPASFWNSNYVPPTPAPAHHQMSDLYSSESGLYSTEPWVHNAAHYGSYAAHAGTFKRRASWKCFIIFAFQHMRITITWLSMEAFYDYRNNMVIVQGETRSEPEEEKILKCL